MQTINPEELDRTTARALVDAGFMPLDEYVRLFSPPPPVSSPRRSNPAELVAAQSGRPIRGGRMKANLRPAVGWRVTYR